MITVFSYDYTSMARVGTLGNTVHWMGWNKSTRIALYATMEMALDVSRPVTAKAVADKYGMSVHHVSKVLTALARAGVATAVRGVGGGHRLAQEPEQTTLLEIVTAIEGPRNSNCPLVTEKGCVGRTNCGLGAILHLIDEQTFRTLESFTLAEAASSGTVHERLLHIG